MARVSIAVLERELEYARKRELYLKRTDRPVKATVDKRAKVIVGYRSALIKTSAGSALLKVQGSFPSIDWFGGAGPLGLIVNTGTNLEDAVPAPRGFKASQIHATVGDATPTVKIAAGSGRRYVKYSANAAGEAQSSYSAPISNGTDTTTTLDEQNAKAVALGISAPIVAKLGGDYGRVWFTPEKYSESIK